MKEDNLFTLIKTMDKAEKRNFRMYLSKYNLKKEVNAQILFDAVESMDTYDKPSLIEKIKDQPFAQNLNYEKHRLQQLILNFFIDFHKDKHVEIELRNLLNQIHILIDKNLMPLALKLINKGIASSRKYHYPAFTYAFINKKLLVAHTIEFNSVEFEQLLDEYDEIFAQSAVDHESHKMYRKFVFQSITKDLSQKHKTNNDLDWLLNDPLFTEENQAQTKVGQSYLYHTKYLYYTILEQHDRVFEYVDKAKNLFEEDQGYLEGHFPNYLSICFSYVRTTMNLQKFDLARDILTKMEAFPSKYKQFFNFRLSSFFYSYYYGYLVWWHRVLYKYEEASQILETKESFLLDKHFFNFSFYRRMEFMFDKVAVNFALCRFQGVIEELENIEKLSYKEIKPEQYYFSKLLGVLAYYELSNFPRMIEEIESLKVFRRKKRFSTDTMKFEAQILRALKKKPTSEDLYDFLVSQKEKAYNLLDDANGENLFPLWYEARTQKISINELVASKRLAFEHSNLSPNAV